MKRYLCLMMLAAAIAIAVVSCDNDKITGTATPIMTMGQSSVVATYEGGSYLVRAHVSSPVDDGVTVVEAEDDWVNGFDLSVEDTVQFNIDYYAGRENRETEVRVLYLEGTDTLTSGTFTVIQEWNTYYEFTPASVGGYYYGMANVYNNEGNGQFTLLMSDSELHEDGSMDAGGSYYSIDIWAADKPEGTNYVYLPEGDYEFGLEGAANVFTGNSVFCTMNEEGDDYDVYRTIVGGTMTVERSGDVTTLTAEMDDEDGGVHAVSYTGVLEFEDESLLSSLDGDLNLGDFSSVACEARYYGDYYSAGTANWVLCIYPETGTGFSIDYCGDSSFSYDSETIPTGTFTAASEGGSAGTFLSGSIYSHYLSGTWLVSLDEDGALTEPYAPLTGGTIKVAQSGGNYTVTIDGIDDRGNSVTASWTGAPTFADYTIDTNSVSGKEGRKTDIAFVRAPFAALGR